MIDTRGDAGKGRITTADGADNSIDEFWRDIGKKEGHVRWTAKGCCSMKLRYEYLRYEVGWMVELRLAKFRLCCVNIIY
jgi:hypothetical protein